MRSHSTRSIVRWLSVAVFAQSSLSFYRYLINSEHGSLLRWSWDTFAVSAAVLTDAVGLAAPVIVLLRRGNSNWPLMLWAVLHLISSVIVFGIIWNSEYRELHLDPHESAFWGAVQQCFFVVEGGFWLAAAVLAVLYYLNRPDVLTIDRGFDVALKSSVSD